MVEKSLVEDENWTDGDTVTAAELNNHAAEHNAMYDGTAGEVVADVNNQSVVTDKLNSTVHGRKYLAQDGATDDATNLKSLLEDNDGGSVKIEDDGVINIDTAISVTLTSGDETTVEFVGWPTIDLTGVRSKPILDFSGASGLKFKGGVTFKGDSAGATNWATRFSAGFEFDAIIYDGGSGGFDLRNATDPANPVDGRVVVAKDQHDTENGTAAGVHITSSEHFDIDRTIVVNSDRGTEIEDDSRHGRIGHDFEKGISNAAAATPGAQKSLSITAHTGTECEGVDVEGYTLIDCDIGPKMSEAGGAVKNCHFRNGTEIDTADAADALIEGDGVSIGPCRIENPNTTRNHGYVVGPDSGDVTIRGYSAPDAPDLRHVRVRGGDVVTIENPSVAVGTEVTNHVIDVDASAGVTNLILRNLSVDGQPTTDTVRVQDNGVTGGNRFGCVFSNCELVTSGGTAINVSQTGNSPVQIDGRTVKGGSNTLPDESQVVHTHNVGAFQFAGAVAVQGVGTEDLGTSPTSAPTGAWAEGTTVRNSNADNNEAWLLADGTWVQTA